VADPQWKEIKVKADLAEIDRVRAFLCQSLHKSPVAEEIAMKLELALHEIFVNIVLHAYPEGKGSIVIRLRIEEGVFYAEIRDHGIPFNLEEMPPLDLDQKLRSGTGGGYGIFLIKALTDGYSYRRDGNDNVLTIHKRVQ
jgi:anti-sigma regulatory factor (Ser/Thr protein kinase)